jgi:hypothetical protein
MRLEFYLFLRNSYDKMLYELDILINIQNNIENYINNETNFFNITSDELSIHNNMHFFIEKQKHIKTLKEICNKKIEELCSHTIVEDLIDISPDKSQKIKYCSICEYTIL